jgi:hypothetical protein
MGLEQQHDSEHSRRFITSESFFSQSGSGWMKLSRAASIGVVQMLSCKGMWVISIDVGEWEDGGFRVDHGEEWNPPSAIDGLIDDDLRVALFASNRDAENFIRCVDQKFDTFIITALNLIS